MKIDTMTALQRLKEGNRRFVEGRSTDHFSAEQRLASLAGQEPWAVIVGCSDSRVPVEVVFDVDAGELFVVRTAGHTLSDVSLASVRFAVQVLGVNTIVVLGHEDCGAVKAALNGAAPAWLAPIVDAIDVADVSTDDAPADAGTSLLAAAVDTHANNTVHYLRTWFAQTAPELTAPVIVGAAYQLASGEVHWLD